MNADWASGSDLGCCGRDLQPPETERRQLLADRPLVQGDAELRRNAGLKIAPPPAHHTIFLSVRASLDSRGKRRHLFRGQPPGALWHRPVHQSRQTLGIVAMHPFGGETAPRKVS